LFRLHSILLGLLGLTVLQGTWTGLAGQVDPPGQRRLIQPTPGSLAGVTWDSTRAAPLVGARVVVFGTDLQARSDSVGQFLFPAVPPGEVTLSFSHARLDSLGAFPMAARVRVREGERTEVELAVPSISTILANVCVFRGQPPGSVPLVGRVLETSGGGPVPSAQVIAEWEALDPVRARNPDSGRRQTVSDGFGRFVLCGIPTGKTVRVQASFLDQESGSQTLTVEEEAYGSVDLGIQFPAGFLSSRLGPVLLEEGSGVQGVQGWIREPGSRAPIRGAQVTLRQTPGTVVVTGETSSRGFFRLRTPVPGTYALEAEALGYGEALAEGLTVEEGRLEVVNIEMAPAPLALEPLVAVAEPRRFQLEVQGFYDRREHGFGYFVTPEQLESWTPMDFAQVFRRLPGLTVLGGAGPLARILAYRPNVKDGPYCEPQLYVDGVLTRTARPAHNDDVLGVSPGEIVNIRDLEAVEFYPGAGTVPLVWSSLEGSRCGTIVLWTKSG